MEDATFSISIWQGICPREGISQWKRPSAFRGNTMRMCSVCVCVGVYCTYIYSRCASVSLNVCTCCF